MNRVVVTGGSSGIGLAIVQYFLAAGYEVISVALRPAPIESRLLRSVVADLSDAAEANAVLMAIAADTPATTVVHCAGAIREKPIEVTTIDDISKLANLHLTAALSLVQSNLAAMKQAHYGRIVLISTRAVLGLARRTAYSATKAGMLSVARTWALELGKHGVTVNVVAPGPIADTEMFDQIVPAGSERWASLSRQVPVGRLGMPGDVARAVLFLADPSSSFITGQTLFVCGGTSIGSLAL